MRFLNRKGLIKADIDNLPDGMPENIVQKEREILNIKNKLKEKNILSSNKKRVASSWGPPGPRGSSYYYLTFFE